MPEHGEHTRARQGWSPDSFYFTFKTESRTAEFPLSGHKPAPPLKSAGASYVHLNVWFANHRRRGGLSLPIQQTDAKNSFCTNEIKSTRKYIHGRMQECR